MRTVTVDSSLAPRGLGAGDLLRLSVEQYHAMIDAGILTSDDPVELLEGWLVRGMPKNPLHRVVTRLTRRALEAVVPAGWYVDSQEPVTLADSEPEPDVSVIRGETTDYLDRHPQAQDVGLLVEIAESSLTRDRTWKRGVYARAAIVMYWLVNLADRTVEVFSEPSGAADSPDYARSIAYGVEDEIPLVLDGVEAGRVRVASLFPPA